MKTNQGVEDEKQFYNDELSLWVVQCNALDTAVVLAALEHHIPGLVFLVYNYPGGTSKNLKNRMAHGYQSSLWRKLHSSFRSECRHPLKGGSHLSLRGVDLNYFHWASISDHESV